MTFYDVRHEVKRKKKSVKQILEDETQTEPSS